MNTVYQVRNTENGRVYIGATIDLKTRWATHKSELRHGHHISAALQHDWNTFGPKAFAVDTLEEVTLLTELGEREAHWITHHIEAGIAIYNSPTAPTYPRENDSDITSLSVRKIPKNTVRTIHIQAALRNLTIPEYLDRVITYLEVQQAHAQGEELARLKLYGLAPVTH